MGDSEVVKIFDTTLRDGEQSPGATLTIAKKLQVASQLERLNVDIIEAGFPAASPGDLAAVKEIAQRTHGIAVAGLARAHKNDIDAVWEAVREAELPVIHIVLATSDIHLQYKLNLSHEEVLQRVQSMVAYARNLCPTVEFRPRMLHVAIKIIFVACLRPPSKPAPPPSIFPTQSDIRYRTNIRPCFVPCVSAYPAWSMSR